MTLKDKPPIGLMPKKYHDQQRAKSIAEAIDRYIAAKMNIPKEWVTELNEILEHMLTRGNL